LTFGPDDRDLPVPFSILGDALPEDEESFSLTLSIDETKNGLRIGDNSTTTVKIIDNDSEFNMSPMPAYIPPLTG
jgi:hypothetical protein